MNLFIVFIKLLKNHCKQETGSCVPLINKIISENEIKLNLINHDYPNILTKTIHLVILPLPNPNFNQ